MVDLNNDAAEGWLIEDADLARLSPLIWRHIEKNPHLGRVLWQSIKTANGKFGYGLDLFSV